MKCEMIKWRIEIQKKKTAKIIFYFLLEKTTFLKSGLSFIFIYRNLK